jgi:hypothetical protein
MTDLLTIIGARRGVQDPEPPAVDKKSDPTFFRAMDLAAAEVALARADFMQALALADGSVERSKRLGMRRGCIIALELGMRALVGLERWDELLARAGAALAESETAGFRTRTWRMLATRARAREASGNTAGARDDRSAARAVLEDMAGRLADPQIRAAFEADPAVLEVRIG